MRFLIDENVPASVTAYLRERGHEVVHALELFLPGEQDEVIASAAAHRDAIIVTWNRQDFKKLTSRAPRGQRKQFRALSTLTFRCPEPQGAKRLREVIDLVEFEHQRAQAAHDSRLFVEICRTFVKIIR